MIPHALRCTAANARRSFHEYANYRADNVAWACAELLSVLVGLAVWRAVAAQQGHVGGYDAVAFTKYFVVSAIVQQLTLSGPVKATSVRVQNGKISAALVRPMHPLLELAGNNVAVRGTMAIFVVPASLAVLLLLDVPLTVSPVRFACALVLWPLVCVLRFVTDGIAGATAFWIVRNDGLLGVYRIVRMFCTGAIAPLAVFPGQVAHVLQHSPFYYVLGYPVELVTAQADVGAFPAALATTAAWTVAMALVLRVVWRRGERAHESVGI